MDESSEDLGPLPKSDRADELEELSKCALNAALPVDRFRFRSEPGKDRGIDNYLEVKVNGNDTNFRAQIQLKAADSWSFNADGTVSLEVATSNLNYLLGGTSPLYIYWNACSNELRYVWARDEEIRFRSQSKSLSSQQTVTLRFKYTLNEEALSQIHSRIILEAKTNRLLHTHLVEGHPDGASYERFTGLLQAIEERKHADKKSSASATKGLVLQTLSFIGIGANANSNLLNISDEQVDYIAQVLDKGGVIEPKASAKGKFNVVAVPIRHSRVLGLMVMLPWPLTISTLKSFFPEIGWKSHLSYLRKNGLVEFENGRYSVTREVARSFIETKEEREQFVREWLEALEPLIDHPDVAFFSSILKFSVGEICDAAMTIVVASNGLVGGRWSSIFLNSLLEFDKSRILSQLSERDRVRYFEAVARCFQLNRQFEKAVSWYLRLYRFSKKVHDAWGVRQSYHGRGIAYLDLKEYSKAESCFRKALSKAEIANDRFLQGRTLFELAMTIIKKAPDEAASLLNKSEAIKLDVDDKKGIAGVCHGRGVLSVQREEYAQAINEFKAAAAIAEEFDDRRMLALEKYNVGCAYLDLGDYYHSLKYANTAIRIARDNEDHDIEVMAQSAKAIALANSEQYKLAENAFLILAEMHSEEGNEHSAMIAIHDAGAMLVRQNKFDTARELLLDAVKRARKLNDLEWTETCLADVANSYFEEGRCEEGLVNLRKFARNEEKRSSYHVAAKLWLSVWSFLSRSEGREKEIVEAMNSFLASAERSKDESILKLDFYSHLHLWHWNRQEYDEAISTLKMMASCARSVCDIEMEFRAQDQIGVCLQEIGRHVEAVKFHQRSLPLARRLGKPLLIENALNNYGSALREIGKYARSIKLFEEAEESARERFDYESEVSIAHNRALSIEFQNKFDDAEKVLIECRKKSQRWKLEGEYVRALHGLANLAWHKGDSKVALRRYAKALSAAKSRQHNESLSAICLNYANALWHNEWPEKAIEILRSTSCEFENPCDGHVYHSLFADLYEVTGDLWNAEAQWLLAERNARMIRNQRAISRISLSLGDLYLEMERFEDADRYYVACLQHELEADIKVGILLNRLGVLLELKRKKDADKVFHSLKEFQDEGEFVGEFVQAHEWMGDYEWQVNAAPVRALSAYFTAILIDSDRQYYIELVSLIVSRLCELTKEPKVRTIKTLRRQTRTWLTKNQEIKVSDEIWEMFLWPFSAAERIVSEFEEVPSQDEFATILDQEFSRVHGLSET